MHTLEGHRSTVRCVKVLNNRPIAVSGSRDATVRVWNIDEGTQVHVLRGHTSHVRCLEIFGNKAVSGSYDNTCRVGCLPVISIPSRADYTTQSYGMSIRGNVFSYILVILLPSMRWLSMVSASLPDPWTRQCGSGRLAQGQ